jgi:hypothetical protein
MGRDKSPRGERGVKEKERGVERDGELGRLARPIVLAFLLF